MAFTKGRVRPALQAVEATSIGGWFWIALAEGRFDGVTVTFWRTREVRRMRTVRPY